MILNARRLKVVMVERFPSFGTKAFVICCVATEDSNTPSLAVRSWFRCVVVNILPRVLLRKVR